MLIPSWQKFLMRFQYPADNILNLLLNTHGSAAGRSILLSTGQFHDQPQLPDRHLQESALQHPDWHPQRAKSSHAANERFTS